MRVRALWIGLLDEQDGSEGKFIRIRRMKDVMRLSRVEDGCE